jgi:hypothetical protein
VLSAEELQILNGGADRSIWGCAGKGGRVMARDICVLRQSDALLVLPHLPSRVTLHRLVLVDLAAVLAL